MLGKKERGRKGERERGNEREGEGERGREGTRERQHHWQCWESWNRADRQTEKEIIGRKEQECQTTTGHCKPMQLEE